LSVSGPYFSWTLGNESAVLREIADDYEDPEGLKGVTLMRSEDVARLVRLAPIHRVSLSELRELFRTCRGPDESAAWVEAVATRVPEQHQYKEILDTVWDEQMEDEHEAVSYGALRSALRRSHKIQKSDDELRQICQSLMRMAPKHIYANDDRVELDMRPDIVLEAISAYTKDLNEL